MKLSPPAVASLQCLGVCCSYSNPDNPMPQSSSEKRDRFARMFPPRAQKLVDQFRLLENCTSKSNYEWTEDTVKRAWIEIAKALRCTAKAYDLDLTVLLNGDEVQYLDTSNPLFVQEQDS